VRVDVERLMAEQDGLLARRQALSGGLSESDVAARIADGRWVPVHDGVYAASADPLTWHQRAWAGVLHAWPAALTHESALRAAEGPGRRGRDEETVHVAVALARPIPPVDGVTVHWIHKFDPRVDWGAGPPRMRYAEAVVDLVADAATEDEAAAWLTDTCAGRPQTVAAVREALRRRTNHPRRALAKRVLAELAV
jgi:hypothetical protein